MGLSGVEWSAVGYLTPGGEPVFTGDVDAVVCVSSVGKPMAAACAAMLVRQGILRLDTPLREFLPELPSWADPIRLHHLVHHTSGLPDKAVWDIGLSGAAADWTNPTVLGLLATMPGLQAEPGTVFSYSSVGYVCLGTLVERAGGRPLARLAQERLFGPLGMTATRFWSGPALHPPAVTVHPPWYPGLPAPRTAGDGGVWSTVRDLLRWAAAMNAGTVGEELTALLRRPGRLRDGTAVPYAWGTFIVQGEAFAHGGWWPGCCTYVISAPASGGAAAIAAFTGDSGPVEAYGRRLARVGEDPKPGL